MAKHFLLSEFSCKGTDCCGGENLIKEELVDLLDLLHETYGGVMIVSSGYRCPKHNQAVSTTGADGPHTTGLSVDIACSGAAAAKLLELALQMRFTGIGINQKGAGRFVHLDLVPRPGRQIWSY